MKNAAALAAALLLSGLGQTSAQETTALYDPVPPPDSAFVRVLQAGATSSATLGRATLTLPRTGATPYLEQTQGTLSARVGTASANLKLAAGKFYSVFAWGGKLVMLEDPPVQNRGKALLTVYNLSRYASLDLKTADGKTTVISGVRLGSSASRAVNGIVADLGVVAEGRLVGQASGVKLERASAYALVVTDKGLTVTRSTTKLN